MKMQSLIVEVWRPIVRVSRALHVVLRRVSPPGVLALALLLAVAPRETFAAHATPADATAFIRLVGQVRVLRGLDERVWRESVVEARDVEVATGTGFVVSPDGWVVTCLHVVSGTSFPALLDGAKVEVAIDIGRIEVVLPAESGQGPPRSFAASVYASDPQLDLAVLYIGGQNLPYLPLGDSDATTLGDAVSVLGFPFGNMVEVGKSNASDGVPSVTLGSGGVSALRRGDTGDIRYIETNTPINPGNSGGPLVDPQGYALGVVQMRLKQGTGIGWALPVNLVKRFFQLHGLEQNLPAAMLTLAPSAEFQLKGLRLRMPYGFEDRSPLRVQVDTSPGGDSLALRVDRVLTPWSLEKLETALLSDEIFERFHASTTAHRLSTADGGRRALSGQGSGTNTTTGSEFGVIYMLVDLGREKVVARYIGPADDLAMNRSVFQESLAEMETGGLLKKDAVQPNQIEWAPPDSRSGAWSLPTPVEWVVEAGAPSQCNGLSIPAATLSMSPLADFTVAMRAAWRADGPTDPTQAARACSSRMGLVGETSYASRADRLGTVYQIEGIFSHPPAGGLLQLELIAPVELSESARTFFAAWLKTIVRQ